MHIAIANIRRDGGTQPRDHVSMDVAKEYAEAIADGIVLPPVTTFYDGTDYWLADGFHRTMAHELLARATVEVDVRQGGRREAILHSVGANADHGYRRSAADKRRAVLTLLNDAEWSGWSDREIARRCSVSAPLVGSLRPKNADVGHDENVRLFTDRRGNVSSMKTGSIGRKPIEPIGGHVPDKRPMPSELRPQSGQCGLAEAALITGFTDKRLKALALAGEVDHEKHGGRLYFDHEKLAAWMAPAAPISDRPSAGDDGTIPRTSPEEDNLIRRLLDLFEGISTLPAARDALAIWSLSRGKDIDPTAVTRAAHWLREFETHFPEVERRRQAAITVMLERIEADVAG